MEKLAFILSVSFGSLLLGFMFKYFSENSGYPSNSRISWLSKYLKLLALVVLFPIPIINSFWNLSLVTGGLLYLPFLGVLHLIIGAAASIALCIYWDIPSYRAASVFTSSMFTNFGSFGGFISFVLFGNRGFMIVQLFTIFEIFIYYVVGFPLSDQISKGALKSFHLDLSNLKDKPLAFVPIFSIGLGLFLNNSGLEPSPFFGNFAALMVPLVTGILGFSIGMTVRVNTIKDYTREIALVVAVKFLIVPLILIPLGYALGLHTIMEAIPLKVVAVMAFMPVAFHALVPPVLYGFDLDMANSAWIVTTGITLGLVFPILYLFL